MSKGEYVYIVMTPVLFAIFFMFGVGYARLVMNPHVHYKQNVCEFVSGETHDDVCIVDGKVFPIADPDPKEKR